MASVRDLPRLARSLVARRLFGPEHFITFRDYPIVYGRVPKAANSTVKRMLARLLGREKEPVLSDSFWKNETGGLTSMLSTAAAAALPEDRLVFTFVRNPFERLASYYDNKVHGTGLLPQESERMGISKADSFTRVIEIVCDTPSARMDVHVMPQADILVHDGRIVPGFVGRHEHMLEDWERLRQEIVAKGVPDLGPLRARRNRPPNDRDLGDYFADPELVAAVKRRYRRDFELFYPDLL